MSFIIKSTTRGDNPRLGGGPYWITKARGYAINRGLAEVFAKYSDAERVMAELIAPWPEGKGPLYVIEDWIQP